MLPNSTLQRTALRAVGRNALCPGTLRNIDVEAEVHVVSERPSINLSKYDHAAEASIHVPSGRLVVMGCTTYLPEASRIDIPPGEYQVLSLASGLGSITAESESADDLYTVYLWPGEKHEPTLVKHWKKGDF